MNVVFEEHFGVLECLVKKVYDFRIVLRVLMLLVGVDGVVSLFSCPFDR